MSSIRLHLPTTLHEQSKTPAAYFATGVDPTYPTNIFVELVQFHFAALGLAAVNPIEDLEHLQ